VWTPAWLPQDPARLQGHYSNSTFPCTSLTSYSPPKDLWSEAIELLRPEAAEEVRLKETDKLIVLNEVLAAANEKKQQCKDKQWKYTRSNGTVIVFRDIFDKIVSWINKLTDIGNFVAQVDPVHAALPWAAIKFFLQVD